LRVHARHATPHAQDFETAARIDLNDTLRLASIW
jgi:hypothetical protein